MKFKLSIISVLLISVSCRQESAFDTAREFMGHWYKQTIMLPKKLELVNKNGIDQKYWNEINLAGSKYFVLHYFTADCDKCVQELLTAQRFIHTHPQFKNVKFIFIACGPTTAFVADAIHKSGFTLPVYFDKKYFSFKMINNLPLSDMLYDTMLLNDRKQVILFGSVFDNKMAEDLYLRLTI